MNGVGPPRRAGPPRGTPDDADRGVSDLIGFVLVFSLIAAVVAVVSVAGLGSLESARNAQQTDNAERAMEVLSDNMKDVTERGAPSRATEISLEDASISYGEQTEIEVRNPSSGAGDPGFLENRVFKIVPIVYDDGNTQLVYANGAVFRDDQEGGTVVQSWSPILHEERTYVPIVNTASASGGQRSIQSATVLVRANTINRDVDVANSSADFDNVWINVTSPRRDLWQRMLESESALDCSTDGPETVECELQYTPERMYVVDTRIAVALKQ